MNIKELLSKIAYLTDEIKSSTAFINRVGGYANTRIKAQFEDQDGYTWSACADESLLLEVVKAYLAKMQSELEKLEEAKSLAERVISGLVEEVKKIRGSGRGTV
jgi:HPt (histidine-containing phosphotransfer) domain-containing protein